MPILSITTTEIGTTGSGYGAGGSGAVTKKYNATNGRRWFWRTYYSLGIFLTWFKINNYSI